jgi:hypothetical protein
LTVRLRDEAQSNVTTRLQRAGVPVDSIFGLHGNDENDLSGAFAFGLANSARLRGAVLRDVAPAVPWDVSRASVHIQTARRNLGITDIEVRSPGQGLVVFEAKLGSEYPNMAQVRRYARACMASGEPHRFLVALTSHDPHQVPPPAEWLALGVRTTARSWRWAHAVTRRARAGETGVRQKYILGELLAILEGVLGLERRCSNMVYVVSLATGNPLGWKLSAGSIS